MRLTSRRLSSLEAKLGDLGATQGARRCVCVCVYYVYLHRPLLLRSQPLGAHPVSLFSPHELNTDGRWDMNTVGETAALQSSKLLDYILYGIY